MNLLMKGGGGGGGARAPSAPPLDPPLGVLRLTTLKIIKWLPKEAFIHKYSYTDVTTD